MTKTAHALLILAGISLLTACAPPVEMSGTAQLPAATLSPSPMPAPTAEGLDTTGMFFWWNDRVFYEIFVRSFYDSDGDGIGDLRGVIAKLDYLNDGDPSTTADLGVTGIWLMPVTQSPSYHGYDVTDYYTVEQDYGTNEDFRQLVEEAHQRGIAVIIDLVLNHTSVEHPWFVASRQGDPEYADWYIWSDVNPGYRGPWGETVWHPMDGRYFYGIFWEGMPDLNYQNPEVTARMQDVTRFWLEEMGVDGFRLDAVKHLIEDGQEQQNTPETLQWLSAYNDFINSLAPEAFTVGEIWDQTAQVAQYTTRRVDIAFEFSLASAMVAAAERGGAGALARAQRIVLGAYPPGQYATFLTNHDQNRVMSQLGGDIGAAKVAATLLLSAPGVPFIYYGEEIGMFGEKPDERIRTPMQWDGSATAGFTTGTPWEALAVQADTYNVASESADPDSLLSHYRNLIRLRNQHIALRRGNGYVVACDDSHIYAVLRYLDNEAILVVVNLSRQTISDYGLTLEDGPLTSVSGTVLLLGEGTVSTPEINTGGGFDRYTPVLPLPPQSSTIIQLVP